MQKSIFSTGEVIEVTKVYKGLGTHDGEVCDLIQYNKGGVKHLIEAPLLAR